ncbi:MAG: restriction endonuclease [Bdellovibrionales bacterium]|nr:restriction endonuclease [Bdellovibrionales bacterium]
MNSEREFDYFGLRSLSNSSKWGNLGKVPLLLVLLYFRSGKLSNCGHTLMMPLWNYQTYKVSMSELNLDIANMPDAIYEYWDRLSPRLLVNGQHFLKPNDFPILPDEIKSTWNQIVLNDSPDEIKILIDDKLKDAIGNKKWVIPFGATVDLSNIVFGNFEYVELYEIHEEIFFMLRDSDNNFLAGHVSPKHNHWNVDFFQHFGEGLAILKLNLSAIVRDFWVVEERERVFKTIEKKLKGSNIPKQSSQTRIIYLPRVKYIGQVQTKACSKAMQYSERRQHFVAGHQRKCANPSKVQLILAERYNQNIQKGYTYVKPHERGNLKHRSIYRSRSALQLLYSEDLTNYDSKKRVQWFQFERDVESLMKKIGLKIMDKIADFGGDGGIDIYGVEANKDGYRNWAVQCKCWTKNVGTEVIYKLIGSLSRYPNDTRGMVVTTSSFSSNAIKLSRENNFILIDGKKFLEIQDLSNRQLKQSILD